MKKLVLLLLGLSLMLGCDNDSNNTGGSTSVTSVTLNKTATSILLGSSETLTATIAPSDATNKSVTWSSANNSVASVAGGVVTGNAAGSADITVTTEDGSHTATCAVTVSATAVFVTGVTLNSSSAILDIAGTYQLTPTIAPSDATNQNIAWSSNDTDIATVSANGLVTAVSDGSCTITATTDDGSFFDTCSITVNPLVIAVTGVSLNKSSTTIDFSSSEQLTATISPAGATNIGVTWISSAPGIATVSTSGLVSAVSAGNCTITVTSNDGSHTATCAVTVNPQPSIEISGNWYGVDANSAVYNTVSNTTLTHTRVASSPLTATIVEYDNTSKYFIAIVISNPDDTSLIGKYFKTTWTSITANKTNIIVYNFVTTQAAALAETIIQLSSAEFTVAPPQINLEITGTWNMPDVVYTITNTAFDWTANTNSGTGTIVSFNNYTNTLIVLSTSCTIPGYVGKYSKIQWTPADPGTNTGATIQMFEYDIADTAALAEAKFVSIQNYTLTKQ
jgi:uncharacterized protein YjdB